MLKIRARISYKESRIITRFYILAAAYRKNFSYAFRVFRLLFFKVSWRGFTPELSLFDTENEPEKNAWEIGKWYSISPETLKGTEAQNDSQSMKLLSIGREAIAHILKINSFDKKTVLLPIFTCFTVLDPFIQDGWELHFYSYNKDLSVNEEYFVDVFNKIKPSVCVFQSLSGMGFTEGESALIDHAHKNNSVVVVDQTQDIYADRNDPSVDYYCGSLRKWYPFPDGAFLYSEKHKIDGCDGLAENNIYRTSMGLCMFARYLSMTYDDPFYDYLFGFMWTFSVSYIGNTKIAAHTMSDYSRKVLKQQDEKYNCERRKENFRYIYEGIKELKTVKPAFGSIERLQNVPLSFPVYAKDRSSFYAFLSSRGVHTSILWGKPPYVQKHVKTDKAVEYIYAHILSLPCDQRYDLNDMKKMLDIIYEYERKAVKL